MSNKTKYLEILSGLENKMDARDLFYRQLELFVAKTGKVPDQYQADWAVWTGVERRRPWRTQPLVVWRIRKAARIAARKA